MFHPHEKCRGRGLPAMHRGLRLSVHRLMGPPCLTVESPCAGS